MKRNHVNGAVTAALGLTLALSALPVGALAAQVDSTAAPQAAATEVAAQAEDEVTWKQSGTCEWRVTDGNLVVRPKGGAAKGTLDDNVSFPSDIITAKFEPGVVAKANSCWKMFKDCLSLVSVDLSGLDTSQATSMAMMFDNCYKLASVDLSCLDTSSVTNMAFMFENC